MQLLLKASESLSELYSHEFYPPPPPMNYALPAQDQISCEHSSHKWQLKTFQLLFSREMERAEWNQERSMLQQENKMLQQQLNQSKDAMVRLLTSVNRVQSSLLIMNGAIAQGYDQLQSKCDNLEKGNSNNSI